MGVLLVFFLYQKSSTTIEIEVLIDYIEYSSKMLLNQIRGENGRKHTNFGRVV